jgi:hypothetical protein
MNIKKIKLKIGDKYGRLKIVDGPFISRDKKNRVVYKYQVKCLCGKTKLALDYSLYYGYANSCGCLQMETIKKMATTHGMKKTRFYRIYEHLSYRSGYSKNYKNIKNLWKSFEDFRDDMYESYLKHVNKYGEKETTIDRIDNRGHYCKENCRWATYKEQASNTSGNFVITYKGKKDILENWGIKYGIKPHTLRWRIKVSHWPIEKALTVKPAMNNKILLLKNTN